VKVLVLGAGGMLGNRVVKQLNGLNVIAPTRDEYNAPESLNKFKLTKRDWVVNCIGAIPQKNYNAAEMLKLNADYPHLIADTEAKVIQIATDCAFNGDCGQYTEEDERDATDKYGQSKILGELPSFMNLRCSIVGSELTSKKSLFEWLRNQPEGATVSGFANHYWNGITTDAFGLIVRGLVEANFYATGTQHVIPADSVTKYELIKMFAKKLGRDDLTIMPTITGKVDRTLATVRPGLNETLWRLAGYNSAPTVQELIDSMAVE
jgi:dTDP-4-dehydrorhamnose reductase